MPYLYQFAIHRMLYGTAINLVTGSTIIVVAVPPACLSQRVRNDTAERLIFPLFNGLSLPLQGLPR
jgi:hypothetical protein